MATELHGSIKPQYESLTLSQRGGIIYLWLLLSEMFKMTRDVVTSLKEYIKRFTQEGVSKISGENVSVVVKQLRTVCVRLDEINALPDETPINILTGFTICSVNDFKDVFKHQLNSEKVDSLRQIYGSGASLIE